MSDGAWILIGLLVSAAALVWIYLVRPPAPQDHVSRQWLDERVARGIRGQDQNGT